MKIIRKILIPALLVLALSSCHSTIESDLEECPQYTVFTFDVITPDEVSYPDGKIDQVRVFAFDESGSLVGEWIDGEVAFTKDYELRTDYYRPGTTTFVAWAGKDLSQYDFSAFTEGAKRDDLVLLMAKQSAKIAATAGPLYVGEPKGGALTQEERVGTFVDEVHFSLVQITNHFDIRIEGLPAGHTYSMTFTAENSRYAYDGSLLPDSRFEWTTDDYAQTDDPETGLSTLTATYDILRLVPGTKGDYLITITDETGKAVYSFDPLHDYILYDGLGSDGSGNPFRDHLDLNHDFAIRIFLTPAPGPTPSDETYMAVRVTIQNWNLVFRDETLG